MRAVVVAVFVLASGVAVEGNAESPGFTEEVWIAEGDPMIPPDMGAPCTWADDCQAAVCLHTSAGGVCSRWCVDECPDGWACVGVVSQDPDEEFFACSPGGQERALAPMRPFTTGDATSSPDTTTWPDSAPSHDTPAPASDSEEPMTDLGPAVPDTSPDSLSDVGARVRTDVSSPRGNSAGSGGCRAGLARTSRGPALTSMAFLLGLGLFHRVRRRSQRRAFRLQPPEP